MTDSEIIKALECCSVEGHFVCNECPAWVESRCIAKNKYILDLINRLQAENERLRNHIQEGIDLAKQIPEMIATVKAEAYKEFADKAIDRVEKARQKYQKLCKEQGEEMEEHMHIHFNGIIGIIKNLLKELVGEENAE